MKFKILDSLKKEVGILKIEKELSIEKSNDLLKKVISNLFEKGITYIYNSTLEKGKIKEISKTIKNFNEDNIGLIENYLISKGYTMEEIKE